jgi:hypothetical protein
MRNKRKPSVVIKKYGKILKWENYIKEHYSNKHLVYFNLGLGTGLQPVDLQKLKWADIR